MYTGLENGVFVDRNCQFSKRITIKI